MCLSSGARPVYGSGFERQDCGCGYRLGLEETHPPIWRNVSLSQTRGGLERARSMEPCVEELGGLGKAG